MTIENIGCGLQIDGLTLLVHIVDIIEETGCSASAGYDDILKFGHLVEHIVLYFPESLLAALIEDLLTVMCMRFSMYQSRS